MNGKPWTEDEIERLKAAYANRLTGKIAAELGRSLSGVHGMAAKCGLKKSEEFYGGPDSSRLRKGESPPGSEKTRFKKGSVPVNKGVRRPGWSPGRMAQTQFRKGERTGKAADNWRPVGTILADPEGYRRIKAREALPGEHTGFGNAKVWPFLSRHLWEQTHGPIPRGYVVVFKDGDRSNCSIDNLELISRGDLARRNAMWNRFPPELIELIQLNSLLKRKLRKTNDGKK